MGRTTQKIDRWIDCMNCCESHENCEHNCTAFLTERTHLIILLEKHQNCIQKRQKDPKHIHT